jgi:hypothetical protein
MHVRAFGCFHPREMNREKHQRVFHCYYVIQILFMNNMRYFMVIIVVAAAAVGVGTPIVWEYLQLEGAKTPANSVS